MKVTVTTFYVASSGNYPHTHRAPEKMAELDKLGFNGDTESLLELIAQGEAPLIIEVTPQLTASLGEPQITPQ